MKKTHSVYLNVILNIIKNLIYVIFPLITFPYVSRVLMADNLGKVNYALSIESYFAMFAALGISTYGVREGARFRSNKRKLQTFVNEVFTVNIITTIASYIALFMLLWIVPAFKNYRWLILLQSASIILTTIGVDWLNSVFEDYLYITIRSFIVQVALLVLLFITVKEPDDYYKYAFLSVCSNGIVGIMNWFYTRKKYCPVKISFPCNLKEHIKHLLVLFANNLAVNVYLNADVTMLGLFTNDYTVGIYAVVVKVYNVIKAVIAAMFTACIPRLSSYYGDNKKAEYRYLLNDILSVCTLFMFPAVAGLIVTAKPIVLLLSGSGYLEAITSLRIISLGIIGAIYGGIITNCINLPQKREKYNLSGTIIAAFVNVGLNFIFIPLFKECGAALTTVIAEFTVLIYCFISYKGILKLVEIKPLIKHIVTGCIGAGCVFGTSAIVTHFFAGYILQMALTVVVSIIEYVIILLVTQNSYTMKLLPLIAKKNR